jgi:hypothetical protein
MISLEFSDTALNKEVAAPRFVRELDWIDRMWPQGTGTGAGTGLHGRPRVQKYCLAGMAGSYTDFHVDFGGTSVWYVRAILTDILTTILTNVSRDDGSHRVHPPSSCRHHDVRRHA